MLVVLVDVVSSTGSSPRGSLQLVAGGRRLSPSRRPLAFLFGRRAISARMLWRVRSSRGRPMNAPAAFIHPCQPIVVAQRLVAHQRSTQAQQLLLFWPIANADKKRSDLNVGGLTA